jgi:ANTAR domain
VSTLPGSPPEDQDELPQLRAALAARPVIDLAKGVLMAVRRCDEDAAFAELARVSMESNLKVARLAELLVDQVLLPRPQVVVTDVPLRACAAVERWVRALPVPPAG